MFSGCQAIQAPNTELHPLVGGHQEPLKGSRELIPKRSPSRIAMCGGILTYFWGRNFQALKIGEDEPILRNIFFKWGGEKPPTSFVVFSF